MLSRQRLGGSKVRPTPEQYNLVREYADTLSKREVRALIRTLREIRALPQVLR